MRIYYYSATGNSLYAAKTIADGISGCEVVPMSSQKQKATLRESSNTVGFVFPLHYFGLPLFVSECVKRLDFSEIKYIFAVVTCGNSLFSAALQQLGKELYDKGKVLDAGFYVPMVSNYLPLSALPSVEKRQERLKKADLKLQQVISSIARREEKAEKEYFSFFCRKINMFWRGSLLAKSSGKFSCSSSCNSCGLCQKVCPANNIRMMEGKPEWGPNCQECLACLHHCPVNSIEFGSRTVGRERYRHPRITVQELLRQD